MGILENFIVPFFEILFIFATIFVILLIIIRAFFKITTKQLIFLLKYKVFRAKIPDEIAEWCSKALERDWDEFQIKKFLLLHDIPLQEVNETVWIYRMITKEVNKNVRGYKGDNTKGKREERASKLPSIDGERTKTES